MFLRQSHKSRGYRREGLPLWGENILNFLLKYCFGFLIFYLLYNVYFLTHRMNEDFLNRLSYILLFSVVASISAMVLSYLLLTILLNLWRMPRKGITEVNKIPDFNDIIDELVAIVLNGIVIATGLLWMMIGNQFNNLLLFLGFYAVSKLVTRVLAIFLAHLMKKNMLITVGFFIMFGAILMIALMELQGRLVGNGG